MSNLAFRTNYCLILLSAMSFQRRSRWANGERSILARAERRPNPTSSLCSRTMSAMVSWASMAAVFFVAPQLRASINLPAKACAY